MNGRSLTPVTSPAGSWAQAFRLPAGGGQLSIGHTGLVHDVWLVIELLALLAVVGLALPGIHVADEAQRDEATAKAPGCRRAAGHRRRSGAVTAFRGAGGPGSRPDQAGEGAAGSRAAAAGDEVVASRRCSGARPGGTGAARRAGLAGAAGLAAARVSRSSGGRGRGKPSRVAKPSRGRSGADAPEAGTGILILTRPPVTSWTGTCWKPGRAMPSETGVIATSRAWTPLRLAGMRPGAAGRPAGAAGPEIGPPGLVLASPRAGATCRSEAKRRLLATGRLATKLPGTGSTRIPAGWPAVGPTSGDRHRDDFSEESGGRHSAPRSQAVRRRPVPGPPARTAGPDPGPGRTPRTREPTLAAPATTGTTVQRPRCRPVKTLAASTAGSLASGLARTAPATRGPVAVRSRSAGAVVQPVRGRAGRPAGDSRPARPRTRQRRLRSGWLWPC